MVAQHHSITASALSPEEVQALQENENISAIFSAIEENAGEALGSYAPQILGPALLELLTAIPDSFNPLFLVGNSLINKIKRIPAAIISSCAISITPTSYFVSSNTARTLLQLSTISGVSAASLYFKDHPLVQHVEEHAKDFLQISLEIVCSYLGMLLVGTDESFKGYLQKIIPAVFASKMTETVWDFSESYAITAFALPFFVSSIVYNQKDIRDSVQKKYTLLKNVSVNVLSGETKKQLLQPIASGITEYITNKTSNIFSQAALQSITHIVSSSNRFPTQASVLVGMSPFLTNVFSPLIFPVVNQHFAQAIEEQVIEILGSLLNQYLIVLQQDDMQELLLKIQQKLQLLDPEVEELKNQFHKKVFFKMTGKNLPLDSNLLNVLNKKCDLHDSLFTSFKHAPIAIRMLWNNYSYDKKVDQALTLELLLQGFVISALSNINNIASNTTPELPSLSYTKVAGLGINLIL